MALPRSNNLLKTSKALWVAALCVTCYSKKLIGS